MTTEEILALMDRARRAETDNGFRQSCSALGDEKNRLREQIQMLTAPEIASIIKKLRHEEDITTADLEFVRLWVIGDAEGYLQMENNLQRWLEEYDAVKARLARHTAASNSVADLVNVMGLLEEAIRLGADIANLLEKKERVANFEQSTRDPASLNKAVLAALLSRKLESDQS